MKHKAYTAMIALVVVFMLIFQFCVPASILTDYEITEQVEAEESGNSGVFKPGFFSCTSSNSIIQASTTDLLILRYRWHSEPALMQKVHLTPETPPPNLV